MISQADIIKTLINNNCTDESVMSTALSPDCTPPKLMEKLTETERFNLALDLSMKLGLDVMPLWKTWALRCLCNRNFQKAREKFRHCFVRLRLPSGRTSPIQSNLLNDILSQLSKMNAQHLSLTEEIELIIKRQICEIKEEDLDSDADPIIRHVSIKSKPGIYAECMHYLNSYGNSQDFVRFYVQNHLWDEAVKVLIEKSAQIKSDKFFINDVVFHSASQGCLNDLVKAFLAADRDIILSTNYFKTIYNFCLRQRRYNLLYYFQSCIGDFIAAANTQIKFFFLKKPIKSYRDLNHRITSLTKARKNYQDYLDKLSALVANGIDDNRTTSSLFTLMPREEVERQIKLIYLQIDITRNFALNEVSGVVSGIEIDVSEMKESKIAELPDNCPVTLFESDERRKTFLAALVLVYFDLSCSSYLSKYGLDLACQLIKNYGLDKYKVFKTAMRIIIEDESCDILENANLLLERIREDFLANNNDSKNEKAKKVDKSSSKSPSSSSSRSSRRRESNSSYKTDSKSEPPAQKKSPDDQIRSICDEVILDAIESCREADYKMELSKLLSSEAKIKLYLEQGKLSQAQRLACSLNRPDYVMNIIDEAGKLNQNHVQAVCQLWLANYETKSLTRK